MAICRLFVASSSDVKEERELFVRVIDELNRTIGRDLDVYVELIRWETDVAPGMGRPQAIINRLVDTCDIFVGIMWRRFGIPTGEFDGGTEEEYVRAFNRRSDFGRPEILFYFGEKPIIPPATVLEAEQLLKVARMRERLEGSSLVGTFNGAADFEHKVRIHLHTTLRELYRRPSELEIAPGLRVLIEGRLAFCRSHGVPFRTPSVLLALLDIRNGVPMQCLDAVEPGLGESVRARLESFVKSQQVGEGAGFEEVDLGSLEVIRAACRLASDENAKEVGPAHLLAAVLSGQSATVHGLEKRLGEKKFAELKRFASMGGPPAFSTGNIDF